jgi:peptidoglycan hydrolase-like amidase
MNKRLCDLINHYLTKTRMDDVLIDLFYHTIPYKEALKIILADEEYELNFTLEETKEFKTLVKEYQRDSKNIYVLMINEQPVVTIDATNLNIKVAGDDEDEIPIEKYLKVTIKSEMDYDGIFAVCDYYWKEE